MLEIGSVLDGKYKILNEIGHGGMSVVYLALNERANKTWAVKEVRKDGGNDSEVVSQGLVAETEMLKKLNHPNLPSIIDVIDKSDTFIIVMDYIEGRSLQSVLNHSGAQDPEHVLEWAKQLCDVLGYLHSRQPAIIYRDMKPSNVMLKPNGQVALIDFGTAREYKEHSQGDTTWLGTRGYAAPEQFGGRGQTDARTDIYCLGATMYHLLTGYSPADTQFVIYPLGQIVPELAGSGLEKVVLKCCEPDPANRYQSCAELMYALEHVHDDDNAAVRARNKKWRMFMASCIVALVGIVGMAGFTILDRSTAKSTYNENIVSASNTTNISDKAAYLTKAMDTLPDRSDAYNNFLTALTAPDGDGGVKITSEEDRLFVQALDSKGNGSRNTNLAEFSRRNHTEYADFQFRRAASYFNGYNSNFQRTQDMFDQLADDDSLKPNEKMLSSCLAAICAITASGSTPTDTVLAHENNNKMFKDAWDLLKDTANGSGERDKEESGKFYSAMIYREIGKQINIHENDLRAAGISVADMNSMLSQGEQYLSSTDPGNSADMFDEARTWIEKAKHSLNQDKKTDLGKDSVDTQSADDDQ